MRKVFWFVFIAALIAAAMVLCYNRFASWKLFPIKGITTVETTFQGKSITSKVQINHQDAGITPFRGSVGPGFNSIQIEAPKGLRPPKWYRDRGWSVLFHSAVGEGISTTIELERDYRLVFPEVGVFSVQVRDVPGQESRWCKRTEDAYGSCEIFLSAPGTYTVMMTRLPCEHQCETSPQTIKVSEEHPVAEVRWSPFQ
jgi:hypothetical protein